MSNLTYRRPGTRFVVLCEPDERIGLIHNRLIIISPRSPPDFLNEDGTRTPIIWVDVELTSSFYALR